MTTESYKVGVAIALSSNATQIFGALGQHFLKLDRHLLNFQNNWKKTAFLIGGGVGLFGGIAVLKGAEKLIDHGNDLVKIQRDMATAGVNATQVQQAYAKAWQLTAKYQNMSAVEILKMQNDARGTFGTQDQATNHIEPFVDAASFLKAFDGGKHAAHAEGLMREINAAMKSGEIAGKITPEAMEEHVKQLTAMKVAFGDQLKITQYLTAQRAAGVALRNSSDAFRYGMFPALVQENGPNAGVMLMTAFNKIVAGVGNRTLSLQHMDELGLLKKDYIKYDKVGRAIGLKDPEGIANSREAAINFGDWVHKTLVPLLDKQTKDPIRQAQLISGMFPDRNAAKAITEIVQQYSKLTKDAALIQQARAAQNNKGYTAGSWDAQKQAFQTQWINLLDSLGAPLVQTATENLARLNETLSGFSQWAAKPENSGAVQNIMTGLISAGAFLAGGGILAMLMAFGLPGIIAGAVAAVIVAAFTNENFRKWLGADNAILKAINGVFDSIFNAIAAKIKSLGGFLGGGGAGGSAAPPSGHGIGSGGLLDGLHGGGGDSRGLKQLNRFDPGTSTGTRPPTITLALNIDGRTLASVVSEKQEALTRYERVATDFDGSSSFA